MTDSDILDVIRRYEYKSITAIREILNQSCACQGSKLRWSFGNAENLREVEYVLFSQDTIGQRALIIIPLLRLSVHSIEITAANRLHSTYNESNTGVLRIFPPDCHSCIAA